MSLTLCQVLSVNRETARRIHNQTCVRAAERYKVLAEHRCQEKRHTS